MDDVLKKLEALEKRVKELEAKLKSNLLMFGRSYSLAGDTNSDFLIKTRGLVKILYGSKFIDLIKDGKVNCDAKFIYKGSVGSKDGIYITDDGSVYLKAGDGEPINLIGEIGTTYVSFLAEQETTSESKYTALKNIGLIAQTQNDITITSGIVYVEADNKLYLVNNGNIEEFKIDFPNPFPEQFIITKNDNKLGSLLIQGTGKENSLAFNGLYIYKDSNSIINSESNLNVLIKDKKIIDVSTFLTLFDCDVISNMFKSQDANPNSGFRLYYLNGESTLEVDNLIWRNQLSNLNTIGEYWYSVANIISNFEVNEDENDDDEYTNFRITLNLTNIFEEGNKLVTFIKEETTITLNEGTDDEDEYSVIELKPIYFTITSVSDNSIEVTSDTALSEDLVGNIIYRISPENPIRIKNNNLDIIEYPDTSKLRIGDIDKEIIVDGSNLEVKDSGLYSDIGLFKEAAYTSDYQLKNDDNSSRFASTEWVLNKVKTQEPLTLTIGTKSTTYDGTEAKEVTITPSSIGAVRDVYLGGADINNTFDSGIYRILDCTNTPNSYNYGLLLVLSGPGSDTVAQVYFDYSSQTLLFRCGTKTSIVERAWKQILTT